MSKDWPLVKLKHVLTLSDEYVTLVADTDYREVTVRMRGKGIVLRGIVKGMDIASKKRRVVRPDQFLLARIDARQGACGIVPSELDGAVVTNDFMPYWVDTKRLIPAYLGWLSKTEIFVESLKRASEGTTNRVRIKEHLFLNMEIPLPPLAEQQRVVEHIEAVTNLSGEVKKLRGEVEQEQNALLASLFNATLNEAKWLMMEHVAPLIRRPVEVLPDGSYSELGVRSFGKGTFHKPTLSGFDIGTKRIFHIEPGDLIFSNVFAWEGAIAVAKPEDSGRVGSHRFITCLADRSMVLPEYLCFYFLTPEGMEKIQAGSPGGAGRNRTLGLKALADMSVPVPPMSDQLRFQAVKAQVDALKALQAETQAELDSLLAAVLAEAFHGPAGAAGKEKSGTDKTTAHEGLGMAAEGTARYGKEE
ncbi:MAG TPA: restriction endonuclease subunit S [Flavobacteriales bacterium]|nr:restriction endonuclease subunit S [Flavobacteriales bacterium]